MRLKLVPRLQLLPRGKDIISVLLAILGITITSGVCYMTLCQAHPIFASEGQHFSLITKAEFLTAAQIEEKEYEAWLNRTNIKYKGLITSRPAKGIIHVKTKRWINGKPIKVNIVEITKYSTGYNDKNEPRHQTVSYSNDNISGRIDQDSAPGNMNITKVDNFEYTEDDNEYAPRVEVIITDETRHRTLDGTVWEDSRSDNTVGNGIYDEGTESGIEGVDVTMVEKSGLQSKT